jgi:Ca2+-binding RTX toxin-like protein
VTAPVVFPNLAPVITSNGGLAIASVNVAENTTAVTTVTATDADLDTPTFSLVGGADLARFAIDATTGALAFVAAPDFETPNDVGANNTYSVIVRASDGNGGQDDQAITVTVTNSNEVPVISSNGGLATAAINVAENTTAVTTVTATDPDLDTPTFSLAGGADQAAFSIDATTGALAFIAAPDFETPTDAGADNTYDVIVRASDGNGGQDDQAITVTVTNSDEVGNDSPVITSNGGLATAAINVAENTTPVTTVTATDPDLDTPTFSLAGGADQARFTINAATGALAFIAAPDFENPTDAGANNSYDVVVRASDGNGGQDDQAISVTVTDVSDSPAPNDTFAMAENSKNAGTVVYEDVNGLPVAYSIASGLDGAQFAIDATTGALTFVNAPDFEEPTDGGLNNVYEVNVTGTQGSSTETHLMQVTVTNVDGNDITGTKKNDVVSQKKTVNGQQKATGEEDTILGKKGNDKLTGLDGNDTVKGGRGQDKVKGGDGDDNLAGNSGRDKVNGQQGDDQVAGGGGKDKITGGNGNDVLSGGGGLDKLAGKSGDDFLNGGSGKDLLIGGKGDDTFYFKGNLKDVDVVKDFGTGDMIQLDQGSFSSVAAGALSQADFDEFFTYKNGKLAYDDDGAGGGKGVVFAVFANKVDIGASDIMLG